MKPGFALSLAQEGIALYRRTTAGWLRVGEVDPEAPSLTESMGFLRKTVLGLAPQGFQTKLVLPDSQILYLDVEAPGPDKASRRAQIARALEGRTPYAVRDLVFDWSGSGPTVRVAVVARVTLDEAEAFAEEHKFHPVSFVAAPPDGTFDGEPFFGTTGRMIAYLPLGERFDRDDEAVRPIARSAVDPELPPETETGPADDEAPFVEVDDTDLADEPAEPAAEHTRRADTTAGNVTPSAEGSESEAAESNTEVTAGAEFRAEVLARVTDERDALASASEEPSEQAVPLPVLTEQVPVLAPEGEGAPPTPLTEAGQATEVVAVDEAATLIDAPLSPEVTEPGGTEPKASEPEEPVASSDASVNADPAPETAAAPLAEPVQTVAAEEAPKSSAVVAAEVPVTSSDPAMSPPASFASRRKKGAVPLPIEPPVTGRRLEGVLAQTREAIRAPRGNGPDIPPELPLAAVGPSESSDLRGDPSPSRPRPVVPPKREAAPTGASKGRAALIRALAQRSSAKAQPRATLRRKKKAPEAEAAELTVFGARNRTAGRPRYMGVILTLALVAIMAVVAFWSSLFDDSGNTQVATAPAETEVTASTAAQTETAAEPVEPAPLPDAADASASEPDTSPTAEQPAADPATAADLPPDEAPATDADVIAALPQTTEAPSAEAGEAAVADPATSTASSQNSTDPAAEAAIAAATASTAGTAALVASAPPAASGPQPVPDTLSRYGAEGVWTATPTEGAKPEQDADGAPDVASAAAAPDVEVGALPDPSTIELDAAPPALPAPVPFAQLVRYGPDGFVIATPEGVLTPDGFTVYAGRPAKLSKARPEDLVPATEIPVPLADGQVAPTEPLSPNPLAGKRPTPRPATSGALVPDTAAATTEAVTEALEPLPPPDDPRLSGKKPAARPASIAAAAPTTTTTSTEPLGPLAPPVDPRHAALQPKVRPASIAAAAPPAAAAATDAPSLTNATRYAIAASVRPTSRPNTVTAAIDAAVADAVAAPAAPVVEVAPQPEPQPQPQPEPETKTATAEPEKSAPAPVADEVDEPEPLASSKSGGTKAAVAKQATIRNAMDMSDVNLIGVFGSSSDRRALVRMSTGRFVRVKVGDRLDGGQVAAIGDTQLTYVKNGRTITLKMIRDS